VLTPGTLDRCVCPLGYANNNPSGDAPGEGSTGCIELNPCDPNPCFSTETTGSDTTGRLAECTYVVGATDQVRAARPPALSGRPCTQLRVLLLTRLCPAVCTDAHAPSFTSHAEPPA
jgi:hypothetical protein